MEHPTHETHTADPADTKATRRRSRFQTGLGLCLGLGLVLLAGITTLPVSHQPLPEAAPARAPTVRPLATVPVSALPLHKLRRGAPQQPAAAAPGR